MENLKDDSQTNKDMVFQVLKSLREKPTDPKEVKYIDMLLEDEDMILRLIGIFTVIFACIPSLDQFMQDSISKTRLKLVEGLITSMILKNMPTSDKMN